MKWLFTLSFFLVCIGTYAQHVPQKINYQGIARNSTGEPLATKTIKIQLSFISGGSVIYSQTSSVTTNAFGLYNLVINDGSATSTTGSFAAITWGAGVSLKTEIDPENGSDFTDMGTTELNSVPFALEAGRPNLSELKDVTVSAPATGSLLQWDGTQWVNATAGSVIKTTAINGTIATSLSLDNINRFWGPTADVTITRASQVVIATISGVLGTSATAQKIRLGVCHKLPSSSAPVFTAGVNYMIGDLTTQRQLVSASATITSLAPGTYQIGMCIRTDTGTAATVSNSDYSNGFVMVY